MNLNKSRDYFNPSNVNGRVHIVGCGSVGSALAENLARCGVSRFTLWDFDKVEAHNIVNQMFTDSQIGMPKVEALRDIILQINPDADVKLKSAGWNGELMSGYIFLAVDNIDIRRQIVELHMKSPAVKAMFDFRTSLESAQHYAADWGNGEMKENLLATMQFSHEEAMEETPVSACGVTLGVATTVRLVCALGTNNFINFVNGKNIWKFVFVDGFHGVLECF